MVYEPVWKSLAAADLIGVSYPTLMRLIQGRKIPPPRKDESGDYIWVEADLKRIRTVLANRTSRKAVRM